MSIIKDKDINSINILFSICRERKAAYEEAVKHVKNPHLQTLLKKYAEQSEVFIKDYILLNSKLEDMEYADNPEIGGFKLNDDIKLDIEQGSEEDILEACKAGDLSVLKIYDDVLNDALTGKVAEMISRHIVEITSAYDNICGIIKYNFKNEEFNQ